MSQAQQLEKNTIRYWQMSLCWNGRQPVATPVPSIEQALDISNDILRHTGPKRSLAKKVSKLKHEIICNVSPEADSNSNTAS